MTSLTKREQKLSDILVFIIVFFGIGLLFYKTVIAVNQPPVVTNLGPTELTDGSSITDSSPVFNFTLQDDSESVQYEIQITTVDDDYSTPIIDFVSDFLVPGDTFYRIGTPKDEVAYYLAGEDVTELRTGEYKWRVRAIDVEGLTGDYTYAINAEESDAAAFKINFPNKPQDLGPADFVNGQETLERTPTLMFRVTTPLNQPQLKYGFVISRDAAFTENTIIYVSDFKDVGIMSYTIGQEEMGGSYRRGHVGQTLTDGDYYWKVTTIDTEGNESSPSYANNRDVAFTVVSQLSDSDAPIISDKNVEVTDTGVTVTWTTDENTSSNLLYDINENLNYNASDDALSTSHSLTLSSLVPCVTYLYQIQSIDASGNQASDEPGSFTTTGCPGSAEIIERTQSSFDTNGGEISLLSEQGKGIRLQAPVDFSSTNHDFQIAKLEKTAAFSALSRPAGKIEVGDYVYDIHALPDPLNATRMFDEPLVVTISYATADIDGLDERTFKIYRNDDDVWTQLSGCTVNTGAKEVTCTTDHFSTFSLFGQPASTNSGNGSHGGVAIIPTTTNTSPSTTTSTSTNTQQVPENLSPSQFLFLKNLGFGSTHADVQKLQVYLNTHGFPVSTNGAGSNGKETTYFGTLTRAALIKFQEAYKESILKPFGLETGTGIFGNKSREYINSHQ